MQYTIESISDGIATIRYPDGSWAEIVMTADMTEEDFDDLVYQFRPKTGSAPTFVSVGATRTASEKPEEVVMPEIVDDRPDWLIAREDAYGTASSQLEYITENGLEAWQAHVAEIKAANPKE